MSRDPVLLRARALSVGFGRAAILPPIDLELRRGEIWGLIGRNGAGKTTLLRTLLGLSVPIAGAVDHPPAATLGYVPQRHGMDPLVPARAKDLIAEGAERAWSFLRPFRGAEARSRIAQAVEATHTEGLLARRYRDLSEGDKQRVLLARAVAGAPDLLVLDEPTSAMDLVAESLVTKLLGELCERFGMGIVIVSHHLELVAKTVEQLIFLDSDEAVFAAGPVAEVLAHPAFARRYGAVLAGETLRSAPPKDIAEDGHATEVV